MLVDLMRKKYTQPYSSILSPSSNSISSRKLNKIRLPLMTWRICIEGVLCEELGSSLSPWCKGSSRNFDLFSLIASVTSERGLLLTVFFLPIAKLGDLRCLIWGLEGIRGLIQRFAERETLANGGLGLKRVGNAVWASVGFYIKSPVRHSSRLECLSCLLEPARAEQFIPISSVALKFYFFPINVVLFVFYPLNSSLIAFSTWFD